MLLICFHTEFEYFLLLLKQKNVCMCIFFCISIDNINFVQLSIYEKNIIKMGVAC